MALSKSVQERAAGVDADTRSRREARSSRYALRCALWKMSSLKTVKGCARNVAAPTAGGAGVATLLRGSDGIAGYSGLTLCSSLWACSCCSARIRQNRSADIEAAGLAHLAAGGGLYFLTVTRPHDDGDALADTLDSVLTGWRALLQRKWMRAWRDRHAVGLIRAAEITHTLAVHGGSGWHPHLHVLIFTTAPLSADERADFLGKVEGTWGDLMVKRGSRRPSLEHGVKLRDCSGVHGPDGVLAYLAKVQDDYGVKWNVGAELTKGHHKRGRREHSRTPFQIAESAAAGNPRDLTLWHEYEKATQGRKAITWTDGLRAALLGGVETADDDVLEAEPPALVVAVLTHTEWRVLCQKRHYKLLPFLLDLAEQEDYARIDTLLDDALGRGPALPPAVGDTPVEPDAWGRRETALPSDSAEAMRQDTMAVRAVRAWATAAALRQLDPAPAAPAGLSALDHPSLAHANGEHDAVDVVA